MILIVFTEKLRSNNLEEQQHKFNLRINRTKPGMHIHVRGNLIFTSIAKIPRK